MDAIQRKNVYYGKCIVDLNTDPDVEFEEKISDMTIGDMLKVLGAFPEEFLNLSRKDFEEMFISGEAEAFMVGILDSLTEEQVRALESAMEVFLS